MRRICAGTPPIRQVTAGNDELKDRPSAARFSLRGAFLILFLDVLEALADNGLHMVIRKGVLYVASGAASFHQLALP